MNDAYALNSYSMFVSLLWKRTSFESELSNFGVSHLSILHLLFINVDIFVFQ
jgi:hypothetical protein